MDNLDTFTSNLCSEANRNYVYFNEKGSVVEGHLNPVFYA